MLCKKCHTAINAGDESCAYCGANIDRKYIFKSTTRLFCGIVLLFGVVFVSSMIAADKPKDLSEAMQTIGVIPVVPDVVTPVSEPRELTAHEVQLMTHRAAMLAVDFCKKYSQFSMYVSNKGYLYESAAGEYISVDSILQTADNSNINPRTLFLYVKPVHLVQYSSILPEIDKLDLLKIFAAYETSDGFVISDKYGYRGTLSRPDMQDLLKIYDNSHGTIKKVIKGSDDYNQIVQLLGNVNFRYLYKDDKYAVAVVSPVENNNRIHAYLLYNISGNWVIGLSNYERHDKFKSYINENFPDATLDLVPSYNLMGYMQHISGDYMTVYEGIVARGNARIDDKPTFISGTNDFCYIETAMGKKFVCFLRGNLWESREVSTYEQAVSKMNEFSSNPPLFILKQY
ncbi:hypothetical protein FACS1894188_06120 [Clostridia bacterium]|nr:hypothetical protein FACS1894188_06120 [Clostridia bacterium]